MYSNSKATNSRPPSSIASILSNQTANYYLSPNSNLVLFCLRPSLGLFVLEALERMTPEFFESSSLGFGGILTEGQQELDSSLLFEMSVMQGKTIVVLGAEPEWIKSFQQVWSSAHHPYHLALVSDGGGLINSIDQEDVYLKGSHTIAFQRQNIISTVDERNRVVRLGEYRQNNTVADPPIRSSEMMYFDLDAIRCSDNPTNSSHNPSGLFAEEACALTRTAGISERLKCLAISGWDENKDPNNQTAQLVAQMIWYFWEGCHLKKLDHQVNREQLTKYLVEVKGLDYMLHFYKSEQSGKWWFEEPLVHNEFSNQLIPCTYDEYLKAAQDQIPKRILDLINE